MAQITNVQAMDVIRDITNQDLYLYKRKNSKEPISRLMAYDAMEKLNSGSVFVSPDKEDLKEGKGFVVTSYEALEERYTEVTHWTPNIFRGGSYCDFKRQYIKGHEKTNLKQINTFGIDIDHKNIDLYALFMRCDEVDLPQPNLILETPRGFQIFFILDNPFYIHIKDDYKALRVAERIATNIISVLAEDIPVDRNCNPFGFFRMPNDNNILYYNDTNINTSSLIDWSKSYEKENKHAFYVIYGGKHSSECQYISSDWYRALLEAVNIRSGEYASSRNNALFTLALANYVDGVTYEQAYDVLDQWNSALNYPLSLREFERTIKSAYSGRYKGVQRSYVESLLENWTDGSASFSGRNGWYKFKKNREDRKRSHYDEWEKDIIDYLKSKTDETTPYFETSIRELAKNIGIPLSTLKVVLKRSKSFIKKTKGKGRAAKTFIAYKSIYLNHLIQSRKNNKSADQVIGDLISHAITQDEDKVSANKVSDFYLDSS